MKYSEMFALLEEFDLEAETEETVEAVRGEFKPDIERRSHVRAFDDLA